MGGTSDQFGDVRQAGAEYVADRRVKEPVAKPFRITEFEDRAQEEMLDNLGAISYFYYKSEITICEMIKLRSWFHFLNALK
jgi:hypothetical protein